MKCPHCKKAINPGTLLRSIKSEARAEASRENGKKGGRPKGSKKPDSNAGKGKKKDRTKE